MFAIVREVQFDPASLAEAGEQLAEFQALHATQPGYVGTVVVEDEGTGRWVTVTLWQTKEDADAGRSALGPVAGRLVDRAATSPSQLIGTGRVVMTDLVPT
jgi:heme-degrading monooxygenase HmoA